MALRFPWDPQKAARNLAKNGVSFEEPATVFGDPLCRVASDPRHSVDEERFVLLELSRRRRFLAVMFAERGEAIRLISARRATRCERRDYEEHRKGREAGRVDVDEILSEYDFRRAGPNRYASRYAAGSMVVVLEPDVAAVFPSAGEVNEALRALAGIIGKHRPRRTASRRSA